MSAKSKSFFFYNYNILAIEVDAVATLIAVHVITIICPRYLLQRGVKANSVCNIACSNYYK